MTDKPTRPVTKVAEYVVDIPRSVENDEISESLQKSCETKVEDIAVIQSMSQPVRKDKKISDEESMESQPVRMTMVDKLAKAVNNLGNKIKNKET